MDKKTIKSLVNQKHWFHKYEIVPGIITPGRVEVKPERIFDIYGISDDLSQKKVLDIGAWDGAYTFEFERRGAEVTALDIQDPDQTGFNLGKKIKKSNARYMTCSVYDMESKLEDRFDIVFFKGIYYHLKNPLLAFRRVWEVLEDEGMVYFEGAILDFADQVDPLWREKKRILHDLSQLSLVYFVRCNQSEIRLVILSLLSPSTAIILLRLV